MGRLRFEASGARGSFAGALACLLLPALAAAQVDDFRRCIGNIEQQAVARGIAAATAREVLAGVSPLERVVTADRNQPEFVESFATYLGRRATEERVQRGRALRSRYRGLLNELTAEYGVPGQYVVAFWGLESDFGRIPGDVPVFNALATLACDGRRGEYFTTELIDALTIAERGDVDHRAMLGSWAGAMGQTQFMPSVYLDYAVDGDGDGKVDIWNSAPDALASAARYLQGLDWQTGLRWGREVLLPESFDYFLAGTDTRQALPEWRRLGVTNVNGDLMQALDIDASLLLPAGSDGPAFLVYHNFHVIMAWNRSEFFALAVGHLADRIAGGSALTVMPPDRPHVSRRQLMAVQRALREHGHDSGRPDGVLGPMTRSAIRDFQRARGWPADGYPHPELLQALGIAD